MDYFPSLIDIGDEIELRYDPEDLGVATAYHHGTRIGYLAKEKQAVWNALVRRPHRVVVVGKLTDEYGDLVSLDVEISFAKVANTKIDKQGNGRVMAGMASGLAAMLLVVAAIAATQTLSLRGKLPFVPGETLSKGQDASSLAAGPSGVERSHGDTAKRSADPLQDMASRGTDLPSLRRRLVTVPFNLQSDNFSDTIEEMAEDKIVQRAVLARKRSKDFAQMQIQAAELQRARQTFAAYDVLKVRKEDQELRAINMAELSRGGHQVVLWNKQQLIAEAIDNDLRGVSGRELAHHEGQIDTWKVLELAAERRQVDELRRMAQNFAAQRALKAQQDSYLSLLAVDSHELNQRNVEIAFWHKAKLTAEKLAKAELDRYLGLKAMSERELEGRNVEIAFWQIRKEVAEKAEFERNLALAALNNQELLQHSQQVAAWHAAKEAAERLAKAEFERNLALQAINGQELVLRNQQVAFWKVAAQKLARAEFERNLVLQAFNREELGLRSQQVAIWQVAAQRLALAQFERNLALGAINAQEMQTRHTEIAFWQVRKELAAKAEYEKTLALQALTNEELQNRDRQVAFWQAAKEAAERIAKAELEKNLALSSINESELHLRRMEIALWQLRERIAGRERMFELNRASQIQLAQEQAKVREALREQLNIALKDMSDSELFNHRRQVSEWAARELEGRRLAEANARVNAALVLINRFELTRRDWQVARWDAEHQEIENKAKAEQEKLLALQTMSDHELLRHGEEMTFLDHKKALEEQQIAEQAVQKARLAVAQWLVTQQKRRNEAAARLAAETERKRIASLNDMNAQELARQGQAVANWKAQEIALQERQANELRRKSEIALAQWLTAQQKRRIAERLVPAPVVSVQRPAPAPIRASKQPSTPTTASKQPSTPVVSAETVTSMPATKAKREASVALREPPTDEILLQGATTFKLKAKGNNRTFATSKTKTPDASIQAPPSKLKLRKKIVPPLPAVVAKNKSNFSRYAVQSPLVPDLLY